MKVHGLRVRVTRWGHSKASAAAPARQATLSGRQAVEPARTNSAAAVEIFISGKG